ncbi:sphingosine kinase 1-like [Argiope bruennichi]|uniref:sphingosine kinase n=1 Tax=Argiope bruennichi TaxID=94029 RepID=A0A8T0EGC3_ARGBR|nr:sphingosine kinase 1-like [Argiope bruennichi]KAF8771653.1 Sphingosine kinase 2 like protein [Argiope bruennichi]
MAFRCPSEAVILEESFYSFPLTSVVCNLILTEKVLFVGITTRGKTEVEKVFLSDIIGCHAFRGKSGKTRNETLEHSAYFCIYAYPLKTSGGILSKQLRREKRTLTFLMRKHDSEDENFEIVDKWQRAINCLLRGKACLFDGEVSIPDVVPTSKKFLVLINPKSGSGKAYQVFKERVIPLFVESDTQYEVLVTDRANCARDYVKKTDVSQWDGIIVVSGDGLLFEVYNGLMARPDWKEVVKIPIGVIPGGSGNGLARAINYAVGEPYDVTVVTPSVLNILKGRVAPMDLVRVETPKECFYSFLSIGWGLMADIDIESERLRALGEARFAVWGVIRAIGLRKYKGKLSYLPVSGYKPNCTNKIVAEPRPKRSKTIDCHLAWSEDSTDPKKEDQEPIFRSKSFGAHDPSLDDETDVRLLKFSYSAEQFNDTFLPSAQSPPSPVENIPHIHCDSTSEEPVLDELGITKYCPPLDEPVPDDWVVIDDEFVLVYACHQTHLSTDVLFAPEAKMDDGIMWLIVIKAGVSRAQAMYFLACLQTGDHVHIPYVDVIPVHAFRLEPFRDEGYLTVDGEVIPCCNIQAEVMPSVARVMTR